jgi:hypothetical protein
MAPIVTTRISTLDSIIQGNPNRIKEHFLIIHVAHESDFLPNSRLPT